MFSKEVQLEEISMYLKGVRPRRCCQDYGQVFSTPQGAATPKNFQNPDFGLKWRDFWVFL